MGSVRAEKWAVHCEPNSTEVSIVAALTASALIVSVTNRSISCFEIDCIAADVARGTSLPAGDADHAPGCTCLFLMPPQNR